MLSGVREHRWLALAVSVVVLLIAGLGIVVASSGKDHTAAPPAALPSPQAPDAGGGVDLAGWKLSIPEANDDGNATSIEPATTKAPWLSTAPDGGLMFWAPTDGATTENSEHPRTELQSLTNFPAGSGPHTLTASLTLLQLPLDGRGIIIGQIHGADDISSVPYVMLRIQKNQLRVVVKQVQDGDDLINYRLLDNVGLNSRIDYTISDLGNGAMTFTATNNGITGQATAPVPAEFHGATVRFQAGDYQQANESSGAQDGGRVTFHRLVQQ
jgi:hypothetical protein